MKPIEIIRELKIQLNTKIPGLIKDIIIFGSTARGDSLPDSDIDLLIILKNDVDWKFKDKIYELVAAFNTTYEIWVDLNLISEMELSSLKGRQPFVLNAISEGIFV